MNTHCTYCKHFFKVECIGEDVNSYVGFCMCPRPKWNKSHAAAIDITDYEFMKQGCDMYTRMGSNDL